MANEEEIEYVTACSWCGVEPATDGYFDEDHDPVCKDCYEDAASEGEWGL